MRGGNRKRVKRRNSGFKKNMFWFTKDTGSPRVGTALSQKHFLGSKYFKILHEHFRDMGGAVLGGGGETYISRYGRCCFKIWEVLYWGGGVGGHKFRDMGGAVSRYGRGCVGGGGGGQKFRDMGGAVSRYERCCFEI